MQGFHLLELAVVDLADKQASVPFGDRLSVVEGASDTGKSYIFECIDFLLGGRDVPRQIQEAAAYQQAKLRFRSFEGIEYALSRSLTGGEASLIQRPDESSDWSNPLTLAAQHDSNDPHTISTFLLNIIGMPTKAVRIDATGKKRTFSFRDFIKFVCIDEEQIITKDSPIISRVKTKTADKRIFNLILTGQDDEGVVTKMPPKEKQIRSEAALAVIDGLYQEVQQAIAQKEAGIENWQLQLSQTESHLATALASLRYEQEQVASEEKNLQTLHTQLTAIENRIAVIEQLLARFNLLNQQYSADIARLDAIGEVGHYFAQLKPERCPTCGALPEHHDASAATHLTTPAAIDDLKNSALAEAQKVKLLQAKLNETIEGLQSEQTSLNVQRGSAQQSYVDAQKLVQETVAPRLKGVAEEFERVTNERSTLLELASLHRRLEELEKKRLALAAPKKKEKDTFGTALPPAKSLEDFSLIVESLLTDWGLPNVGRVTFNEEKVDIVIGGKDRGASGKGVRALAYAAFVIGVMRHCQTLGLPHPGFVVLDSPLVTYKKPDTPSEEALPTDVVENFYRYLSKIDPREQIIIFENEQAPDDVIATSTYTHFSKSSVGRYGFFPVTTNKT
jgi:hypothetical protein